MLQGRKALPTLLDFLDIVEDIARGVAATHDKKIVFRELKPAKLMVDREGRVRMVGFGNAANQNGEDYLQHSETPMTNHGGPQ
jgi:serine/threonine protein kinase